MLIYSAAAAAAAAGVRHVDAAPAAASSPRCTRSIGGVHHRLIFLGATYSQEQRLEDDLYCVEWAPKS